MSKLITLTEALALLGAKRKSKRPYSRTRVMQFIREGRLPAQRNEQGDYLLDRNTVKAFEPGKPGKPKES